MQMFAESVMIVAHPDDEALWFSSVLERVQRVVFVYSKLIARPDISEGRKRSIPDLPIKEVVDLKMEESNCFEVGSWTSPQLTDYGIALADRKIAHKYKSNFFELKDRLTEVLNGCRVVFTHSPWGEYGHEEHVQVYRAVKSLQPRFGFDIWYPNYASNRSMNLFNRQFNSLTEHMLAFETRPELGKAMQTIYEKHNCWTWYKDWRWFEQEVFFKDRDAGSETAPFGQSIPMNLIKVKYMPPEARKKNPYWRRGLHKLNTLFRK